MVPNGDNTTDQSAPLTQADDNSKKCAAEPNDQQLYKLGVEKGEECALNDEPLFEQGHERHEGYFCPICTLPIPFPVGEHIDSYVCCMKSVCKGCVMAGLLRGMGGTCAFCRTPVPGDDDSCVARVQKRVGRRDSQ